MDKDVKQASLQARAKENLAEPGGPRILWSRHATLELTNEGWTRRLVEEALTACEIIEDYPLGHRTFPDCLVLGTLKTGQPVHAVIAIDARKERLFVVTIYSPSIQEWNNDWRTRK